MNDLNRWVDANDSDNVVWYLKRLSANDTLAGGSNQAGPYIPRDFLLEVIPELNRPDAENPDVNFPLYVGSHIENRLSELEVRAVWYNNSLRGGTRNETRVTGFGGSESPLLDPEHTGALVVFAFHRVSGKATSVVCQVWICRNDAEEELLEARAGEVEPGEYQVWTTGRPLAFQTVARKTGCWLKPEQIPAEWLTDFPTGAEVIRLAVESSPALQHDVDKRILIRRDCEYQIFKSIEEAVEVAGHTTRL